MIWTATEIHIGHNGGSLTHCFHEELDIVGSVVVGTPVQSCHLHRGRGIIYIYMYIQHCITLYTCWLLHVCKALNAGAHEGQRPEEAATIYVYIVVAL